MRPFVLYLAFLAAGLAVITPSSSLAQNVRNIVKKIGGEAIRDIESDFCFPANAEEYDALGKNAILMLKSSSAVATELPLRSVYILYKGVRIPLQRLRVLERRDTGDGYFEQVSFYLIPIHYMKMDAELEADFSGARLGFGISSFSAKRGLDRSLPAFLRLDEYDLPRDPDMKTVSEVLTREYPDYVG